MRKYDPLAKYLEEHPGGYCTLTFHEVEGIIGTTLPDSARKPGNYEAWWANDETHSQASGWMRAGWKTDGQPDLARQQVRFIRSDRDNRTPRSGGNGRSQVIVRNLDADVVANLKRKAQREGRSLERVLRVILTRAARPERAELIAEADRIRAMTPGQLDDSVALLREDRDSR